MSLVVLAAAAVVSTIGLVLRRRRTTPRRGVHSLAPTLREHSSVRVLRNDDEIREVAMQMRDREQRIAHIVQRRVARLDALAQPSR